MGRPHNEMMRSETSVLADAGASVNQLPSDGTAIRRMGTTYATAIAVQQARSLQRVEKMAMEEAALLGDDAFYGWGTGKDRVEGPSVYLAMALVRIWGNCVVEMLPVQDIAGAWVFTASFVDLETGFTLQRQFRQSQNWTVYGKFDDARKEDIRFQIGQSKAARNVVLNAVPQWLTSRALDVAKGGVRAKIVERVAKDGLPKVVAGYLDKLASLGVSNDRVLAAHGRKAPGALTVEDLVILAGSIRAIVDGADDADSIFPRVATLDATNAAELKDKLGTVLSAVTGEIKQEAAYDFGKGKPTATQQSDDELFGQP